VVGNADLQHTNLGRSEVGSRRNDVKDSAAIIIFADIIRIIIIIIISF